MTELAHALPRASLPFHVVSLTGQSSGDAMFDTEPNEHEAARVAEVDTLGAADGGEPDGDPTSLDDRLLHRDLKARLFGSDGHVRIGRYDVLRRIGRGGMGTVYVAHDPELDRKVALKVLRADRKRGRERMLQEARALAKLAHPNVVTVHEVGLLHEVGLHDDDRVFVAMELVQGKTLRAWLEASPSRTALYGVFLQAARGLQAAHRAGLVHRDFKPDNVLIGDDGRVRVVDFGVAKATDSLDALDEPLPYATARPAGDAEEPGLTLTGQLLGTPAYMAPEQFLGASVDARTDVFAFCVVLYEALSGRRPFEGDDTASLSFSVLQGQARPLEASDVPAALTALVSQGLSRSADERPAALDRLIDALEAALAPAQPRRSRARWWAASVVALAVGGAAAAVGPSQREPEAEPVAVAVADASERDGEAAAFAAIATASGDEARLGAAEAFLVEFGDSTSEARRAIAHSAAGDVQWRRSCADPVSGLCIDEHPVDGGVDQCMASRRGRIEQRPRARAWVEPAQQHLRAAAALAGVTPPEDDGLRRAFAEAVARARVQLADAELERHLTLEVPAEMDLDEALALSQTAFKLFFAQLSKDGDRLLRAYAEVKQPRDPYWTLVAAARSGMVSETASVGLARAPIPATLTATEREQYCQSLRPFVEEPAKMAHDVYSYCLGKAEEHGLGHDPIVGFCRARLELYPEQRAE